MRMCLLKWILLTKKHEKGMPGAWDNSGRPSIMRIVAGAYPKSLRAKNCVSGVFRDGEQDSEIEFEKLT
ncbi:hypothetical protein TNCV_4849941 [Trichonephila clavipes]|nr:hypothetical protein TNCV_4849941 [Trichonephila clavipes]